MIARSIEVLVRTKPGGMGSSSRSLICLLGNVSVPRSKLQPSMSVASQVSLQSMKRLLDSEKQGSEGVPKIAMMMIMMSWMAADTDWRR